MMGKYKFIYLCIVLFCVFHGNARAYTPTPDKFRGFQQLSPEKQRQLIEKYKKINNGDESGDRYHKSVEPGNVREKDSQEEIEDKNRRKGNDKVKREKSPKRQKPKPELKQPELQPFGYNLFSGAPSTFAPAADIAIPLEYMMGPGDTVIIQLYGKENVTHELTVTREGVIQFPRIGPISVTGLTFGELKNLIDQEISRSIIGVTASITLGNLRSIRVFILGEASHPGSYTVSSLSTMTNALFVSGGIIKTGSLRDIQLKRNGKTIKRMDLYDLLLSGDTSNDERLLPGDVIFIPPVGKTAGVAGQVRRPAVYELKNENKAEQLIALAGGLSPTAYPKKSRIERIDNNGNRTIVDLDLTVFKGKSTRIKNGDTIRIYSILEKVENVVILSGHVYRPGGMAWHKDIRVSDVVSSVNELMPNPDLDYALIKREIQPTRRIKVIRVFLGMAIRNPGSEHDLLLETRDELIVFGLERVDIIKRTILGSEAGSDGYEKGNRITDNNQFDFEGENNQAWDNNQLKYEDRNNQARGNNQYDFEGESNQAWDSNQLKYEDKNNQSWDKWDDIRLKSEGLNNQTQNENRFKLEDSDNQARNDDRSKLENENKESRKVYSRLKQIKPIVNQLKLQATYLQYPKVTTIKGSVRAPGTYPLYEGMTLQGLIESSFGLKHDTDLNYFAISRSIRNEGRIKVFSVNLNKQNAAHIVLEPLDEVYVFSIKGSRTLKMVQVIDRLKDQARKGEDARIISAYGYIRFPGEYPLEKGMSVEDLIRIAGGLSEKAFGLSAEVTRYITDKNEERSVEHRSIYFSGDNKNDTTFILKPYDKLIIKPIPHWAEEAKIEIRGEVRFPGTYPISKSDTLQDVLMRVGGLTELAYPKGAILLRKRLKKMEMKRHEYYKKQLAAQLTALSVEQASSMESRQAIGVTEDLVEKLSTFEPIGRLVIDLPKILRAKNRESLIMLEDNDILIVPTIPQEVAVVGEVQFPTSHIYSRKQNIEDFIQNSGGLTAKGDRSLIYIVKADGNVMPYYKFRLLGIKRKHVDPGDTIVVPYDITSISSLIFWSNISQIVYHMSTSIAALKSIGAF